MGDELGSKETTINDGQGWCVSNQFFFTCSQYDKVTNADGGIVIGYTLDKGHGAAVDATNPVKVLDWMKMEVMLIINLYYHYCYYY